MQVGKGVLQHERISDNCWTLIQAEAERFVMRPFLQGHEHTVAASAASGTVSQEAAGASGPASRASVLSRLRTKSILRPME